MFENPIESKKKGKVRGRRFEHEKGSWRRKKSSVNEDKTVGLVVEERMIQKTDK